MKSSRYNLELESTAACTKILVEETKGLGQRDFKGSTRDCFLFDSFSCQRKQKRQPPSLSLILLLWLKPTTKDFSRLR